MNKREVIEILGFFAAARPGLNFDDATIEVYYLALRDLEPERLRDAALRWLKTNKDPKNWLPTISELRREATHDPTLPSAAEAWAELESAYSPYKNSWREVTSNPMAQHAAQSVFGSGRFGPDAYIPVFSEWTRKSFIDAYNTFTDRDQHDRQLAAGPARELVEKIADRFSLPPLSDEERK